MMVNEVTLILGGNKGDRMQLIERATILLSEFATILKKSSIYQSESWGGVADQDFLNQAMVVHTEATPMAFLAQIQSVELTLGRRREVIWGNRTMDIDILYWGEEIIQLPELKVPHPLLDQRRFVLVPLVEIMPEFVHPISKKSQRNLLECCEDQSRVEIFDHL
ncbi:2-amino-4-hydroxy-6-hydroxymethyldihydropteridine diphosphokinase [Algoriphagus sp.]|uniref:2-amino-4-hydroxy-6- hydroxymethyldihydropteridine diphosphokinase n=1 Tax=Algoriphagus sp. TaxID=1872435 RepID=UPI0026040DF0|nr:2-amino-4-hydroxy-6-hydroxymethyldihydropteridine diphosphokinase [Algoriphagus sp.]